MLLLVFVHSVVLSLAKRLSYNKKDKKKGKTKARHLSAKA